MQKKLMYIVFLLLTVCSKAAAQDLMTVSSFSLGAGDTKEVGVQLTNADTYVGFQFDLYLPQGFTVESFTAGSRLPSGTTPQMAQQADGSYRFVAAALSGNAITGNSGSVLTLTVKAADAATAGSYDGYLRNVKISRADGSGVTIAEQSFTVTVLEDEPYAVLDGTTMTFYYDKRKEERGGMSVGPFASSADREWDNAASTITAVVFDTSFADCTTLTSTAYWFHRCSNLTTIQGIANLNTANVTNMRLMFYSCSGLTSLDVSGFNTANVTDMSWVFDGCSGLTSLDVSYFNTSNVTNMAGMFFRCSALDSINLSGFNTSKVTNMENLFGECHSLISVDVSNFNTENVTNMNYMFGNTSLESINLSSFNTSNVTNMRWMFAGEVSRSKLKELDLSKFNTAKVTNMNGMFANNPVLSTIYVGDEWTTDNISDVQMGDTIFLNCPSLVGGAFTTFDSNHTDYNYAHIDGGTQNPGYLTSIADKAEVAAVIFSRSLYELTMSCATENVRIMYAVITDPTAEPQYEQYTAPVTLTADCTVRAYAVRPSGIQSAYSEYTFSMSDVQTVEMPTMSWSGDEMTLATVTADATIHYILDDGATTAEEQVYTAPVTVTSDVTISAWATKDGFNNSETFTVVYPYSAWTALVQAIAEAQDAITLATGKENVPVDSMTALQAKIDEANAAYTVRTAEASAINAMTQSLSASTDIINQLATAEKEPYAVLSADGLTLTLYYDYKKAERGGIDIHNSFSLDSPYGSITTAIFDTSFADYYPTSTGRWFVSCGNLTTIEGLSNLNTGNVTDMGNMFAFCSSLTSIDLRDFNTENVTDITAMFNGCSSLTSLDVSGFNTANVVHMAAMFANCSGLTSLDLSGFNTANVEYMDGMFVNCSALKTIYVGEDWSTAAITQGSDIFNGCTALVGGTFTAYDASKVDVAYAHIDGGTQNPGYLTSIADKAEVAAVTFSRSMYELTMSCATENVHIMYAVVTDPTAAPQWQQYTAPVTLTADCTVRAYAVRPSGIKSAYAEYTFRMSDVLKVEAPTFSWQGDELTITTATADAELFYQLSDTDVDGDGTVTDADYVLYTAPVEIRRNVTVKAYAAKQGLVNSDVTTLVYPYEAWERLMNTIKYAEEVVAQCQGSTKVTQQELDELALEARRASGLYNERTMTETEILDYAKALEAAAADIWTRHNSTDNYSFDSATGVLTLQNGMTVTEAVNTIGGQVAESVTAILWQNTTALTATDLAVVSNPNLLIYVTDAALAPEGRDNVVANGVADNVVLTSQGTGNIDFYCPQAFTARRISYTREFVQQTTIGVSRGWESIALPFTVQRVEHQTQGTIVPFGSTEPGYRFWLRQLTANGLQGAQTIEANVGYLISMPNSSEYTEGNLGGVVTFLAENAEVPITRPVVSESAQHALLPSFRRMAAQQGVYVLNVSAPRNGYAEGSIFEENYRELLPFQAYTEHLGTQPAPPYFVIGKMGGEGTTGIADVRADVEDADYYDLNGRRLQGKPRQKGVYIRQGRKVIVR